MGAAVEDVHHRRGEQAGGESAEVLVELDAEVVGHGARGGHRDREDGVGAELALVGRAVELAHDGIELALVAGVHAFELRSDQLVDVVHGLQHALAQVAALVAVAQFHGFVLAGGGSAGNGSAAAGAAFENDIGFNGRIATGVKDFARKNQFDFGHENESFVSHRWICFPDDGRGTGCAGQKTRTRETGSSPRLGNAAAGDL